MAHFSLKSTECSWEVDLILRPGMPANATVHSLLSCHVLRCQIHSELAVTSIPCPAPAPHQLPRRPLDSCLILDPPPPPPLFLTSSGPDYTKTSLFPPLFVLIISISVTLIPDIRIYMGTSVMKIINVQLFQKLSKQAYKAPGYSLPVPRDA